MGMFDEIVCEFKLPEPVPAFIKKDHRFQTKDLDCTLDVYKISEDGRLLFQNEEENYTGELNFYTSNICGVGHGCYFTKDGSSAEQIDYKAIFINNRCTQIELVRYEIKDALPVKEQNFNYLEEVEFEETPESFLNSTFFVLWGGTDPENGYTGECIAESQKEIVIRTGEKFQTLHKSSFNYTLFLNKEHAIRVRTSKENAHKKETERLTQLLKNKS